MGLSSLALDNHQVDWSKAKTGDRVWFSDDVEVKHAPTNAAAQRRQRDGASGETGSGTVAFDRRLARRSLLGHGARINPVELSSD